MLECPFKHNLKKKVCSTNQVSQQTYTGQCWHNLSPPLTEKDGTHLPAGHPNVTYFALLAYNHAMSPTFPPIFLHPPWCIWPKWGLDSKGRKNPFSEIEKKKSLTVAKLFQLFQHIDVTQSNVPACLHQRALTEEGQGLSESRKKKP